MSNSDPRDPTYDAILVAEGGRGGNRVQHLDRHGDFVLALGRDVVRSGGAGDRGTTAEICRVAKSCRAGRSGSAPGEFRDPTGVAAGPAGDVYVLDRGNRRVQRFTANGDFVELWTLDVEGSGKRGFDGRSIAVDPVPPHDVLVADEGSSRVLRFTARGRFVGAWGKGVAGGSRFEGCFAGACRAGRAPSKGRWPRELAVDANGTVFATTYLGDTFYDPAAVRTRISRFLSRPRSGRPAGASLAPLAPADPYARSAARPALTNGTTLGLDIDAATGQLMALADPFGVSVLDVVRAPGSAKTGSRAPRVESVDTLPFLQSVNALAVGDAGGSIFLSSGRSDDRKGSSSFTGCPQGRTRRDCHGLIALARGDRPEAVGTFVLGERRRVAALVDPNGSALMRLSASADGDRWIPLGRWRRLTSSHFERVAADAPDLPAGRVYAVRATLVRRTSQGDRVERLPAGIYLP